MNNLPRNIRVTLQAFGLILLAQVFHACRDRNGPDERPPNFIFILVDDLGWTDLGCYGSDFYETPNIDRLASGGVRFTNAYASASICSPSRASILTGRHPARVGITDWIPGHDPQNRLLLGPDDLHRLPHHEITIAEILKENGYHTFFAGKWHLGGEGFLPTDQGFDTNVGGHDRGSPPGGYYSPYKNPELSDGPEGEYLTDRLTKESIDFIRSHRDSAFFLFLSFYTVHTPIQACQRHVDKFRAKTDGLPGKGIPEMVEEGDGKTVIRQYNADYASMVHAMDENLGRLLDALRETGIYDKTVIIFTSDNGGLSTLVSSRGAAPTSVRPLRAGKGWLYEGGIRVPLIIKPEGRGYRAPKVCDSPVTGTDYFPTMLELARIALKPELHTDGFSIVPLLMDAPGFQRDAIFWHYPHYHGSAWKPGAAIRSGDWKLIEFYETGKSELYNLRTDPSEANDISGDHTPIMDSLLIMLHALQKETGAKFPVQNPGWIPGSE